MYAIGHCLVNSLHWHLFLEVLAIVNDYGCKPPHKTLVDVWDVPVCVCACVSVKLLILLIF